MNDTTVPIILASLMFGMFFGSMLGASTAELSFRKIVKEQSCPVSLKETQTMVPFCTIEEVDKQAQRYCADLVGAMLPNKLK